MYIRNGNFSSAAVSLAGVALALLIGADAYSSAASAEVRGFQAIFMQLEQRQVYRSTRT